MTGFLSHWFVFPWVEKRGVCLWSLPSPMGILSLWQTLSLPWALLQDNSGRVMAETPLYLPLPGKKAPSIQLSHCESPGGNRHSFPVINLLRRQFNRQNRYLFSVFSLMNMYELLELWEEAGLETAPGFRVPKAEHDRAYSTYSF